MTRAWGEAVLEREAAATRNNVPGREKAGKKPHISLLLSSSHLPVPPVGQILLETSHRGSSTDTIHRGPPSWHRKGKKGKRMLLSKKMDRH